MSWWEFRGFWGILQRSLPMYIVFSTPAATPLPKPISPIIFESLKGDLDLDIVELTEKQALVRQRLPPTLSPTKV
ncbi:hypothetical protein [Neisseria meningitidis]|uniref:hypothetical protein n=1 Tax=Neisseria meningitidis TaxID=487 RepID=UPI001F0C7410|nr:hypothetical protein [Neisseria meningitidis]